MEVAELPLETLELFHANPWWWVIAGLEGLHHLGARADPHVTQTR